MILTQCCWDWLVPCVMALSEPEELISRVMAQRGAWAPQTEHDIGRSSSLKNHREEDSHWDPGENLQGPASTTAGLPDSSASLPPLLSLMAPSTNAAVPWSQLIPHKVLQCRRVLVAKPWISATSCSCSDRALKELVFQTLCLRRSNFLTELNSKISSCLGLRTALELSTKLLAQWLQLEKEEAEKKRICHSGP